jgi:mono/diheme cytochrome c family protein
MLLGAAVLLASCQSGKIPDESSYAAQLYLNRCGQCHQPYNPNLMTPAMWAIKVDLMQERMKQTGLAPLTSAERETILEYLTSNAGKQ